MDKIFNAHLFDLFSKHIYALFKLMNIQSNWYTDLYKNHILVFNGAWEHPGTEKTNKNDFVTSFDNLISSVQKDGFTTEVQINYHDILISKAHRFVLAFLLKIPITIVTNPTGNNIKGYDYKFFTDRLKYGVSYLPKDVQPRVPNSMDPVWINAMVLDAVENKKDTKVITIFPIAKPIKDDIIRVLLESCGSILYKTSTNLNSNGLLNYVKELYLGEKWYGYTRKDKMRDTGGPNPLRTFFFTPKENVDIIALKTKIRKIYGNKNSVHINDTHDQAIRYTQSILFSTHYLNHGKQLSPINSAMFEVYKNITLSKNTNFMRSEEHTSELQSLAYLVCSLLLAKKKINITITTT